ncbi:hypothetical protein [Nonomuraea sp. NPDC002799]
MDHKALVWVNALAVSRPDYAVAHDERLLSRAWNEHGEIVRVPLEPRWPRRSSDEIFGRQDVEMQYSSDGSVSVPRLREWKLTESIHALLSKPDHPRLTKEAADLLGKLPHIEDLRVTLVVGFKNPMREEDVHKVWPSIPDVALLSPPRDEHLPISWDYSGFCDARGFDDCNPDIRTSLTSSFRQWVELLQPQDEEALDSFGLDLPELKKRAADGLWYGMILNTTPERAGAVVKDSRISVISVGQVAL